MILVQPSNSPTIGQLELPIWQATLRTADRKRRAVNRRLSIAWAIPAANYSDALPNNPLIDMPQGKRCL
jgi:hypothetical protein